MSIAFQNIRVGDELRLEFNGTGGAQRPVEIVVGAIPEHGFPSLRAETGEVYFERELASVTVSRYAGGLPDADFIAWRDYDHNDHVAFRSGHPGNGAWVADGKRMDTAALTALVGRAKAVPLVFRDI